MSLADSERRVRAAARVLAEQWVSHPSEIDRVADSLMRDARTLERAGLLADPTDTSRFSAPRSGGYSGTADRGDRQPPTTPSATSRGATT